MNTLPEPKDILDSFRESQAQAEAERKASLKRIEDKVKKSLLAATTAFGECFAAKTRDDCMTANAKFAMAMDEAKATMCTSYLYMNE